MMPELTKEILDELKRLLPMDAIGIPGAYEKLRDALYINSDALIAAAERDLKRSES
jgi:hypothetical protein